MHLGEVLRVCLITQSYPTLCDRVDCCLPGSSVYELLQARILEKYWQYWQYWGSVAISFSRWSSSHRDRTSVSCVSCIIRQDSVPAESLGKPGKKFEVPCIIPLWSASNSAAVVVNNWHTSSQISISRPCWVTQIFIKRSFTNPWKCAILKHKISKKNENVSNISYGLYCVCPEIHMLKSLSPVLHNVAVLVNAVFIEVN